MKWLGAVALMMAIAIGGTTSAQEVPKDELKFIAGLQILRGKSRLVAANALASEDMAGEFREIIKPFINQPITDWIGEVISVERGEDGNARVALKVDFTPIFFVNASKGFIPGSPEYENVKTARIGSVVRFSGRIAYVDFPPSDPFGGAFDFEFSSIESPYKH